MSDFIEMIGVIAVCILAILVGGTLMGAILILWLNHVAWPLLSFVFNL